MDRSSDILEYTYVNNLVQANGFECGDLCFAKGIELLSGCFHCQICITQNAFITYCNQQTYPCNGDQKHGKYLKK